jgi:hypothetical protein
VANPSSRQTRLRGSSLGLVWAGDSMTHVRRCLKPVAERGCTSNIFCAQCRRCSLLDPCELLRKGECYFEVLLCWLGSCKMGLSRHLRFWQDKRSEWLIHVRQPTRSVRRLLLKSVPGIPLRSRNLNILMRNNSRDVGSYNGDLLASVNLVQSAKVTYPHLLNRRIHWTKKLKYLQLRVSIYQRKH